MRGLDLHTVCEEAMCPNIGECWEAREATFLILGDRCTRRCGFCDVMTARPDPVDEDEPARIASAVQQMGLRFVVLTGVARDDLPDGGARIWAATIRAVREAVPGCGRRGAAHRLQGRRARHRDGDRRRARRVRPQPGDGPAAARPDPPRVRLRPIARGAADRQASPPGQITKSNLILGMGEAPSEVAEALADLRDAGCDLVTMGQYLQPTKLHLPVDRWVHARRVRRTQARGRGAWASRTWRPDRSSASSYHAGTQFQRASAALGRRRLTTGRVDTAIDSKVEESACKPDPVRPPRGGPATISLGARAPRRRSPAPCGLPGSSDGPSSNAPCLALLRVGLAEPARSPVPLVSSYLTVSPLPRATDRAAAVSLCCASARSPPPGSPQHPALRSPDFPRPIRRSTAAARPAPPLASIPPRPEHCRTDASVDSAPRCASDRSLRCVMLVVAVACSAPPSGPTGPAAAGSR